MNREGYARYARQMAFPALGVDGQRRLLSGRVGILGCGGLGSTVSALLARAGVGFLRIADDDRVDITNLHRQLLYVEDDVGRTDPKVLIAAERLRTANHEVRVEPLVCRVDSHESMAAFVGGLDVVVDATDNFTSRFLLNRVAVRVGIPWVYGGVSGAAGMTMTIVPGQGPCLRCVFDESLLASRDRAGKAGSSVLGPVVAVVGALQATEAIRLLVEPSSRNTALLAIDTWSMTAERIEVETDPNCPAGMRERE